jgi:hypothetical protein
MTDSRAVAPVREGVAVGVVGRVQLRHVVEEGEVLCEGEHAVALRHEPRADVAPRGGDLLGEVSTRLQPSGAEFPTSGGPGTLAGALMGSVLLLDKDSAEAQSAQRTAP